MNWSEVLAGLKQGKKYRRKCWEEGTYIKVWCDVIHEFYNAEGRISMTYGFSIEDFEAEDWKEVI